jgi:rhodanese-related sulfurtransferase
MQTSLTVDDVCELVKRQAPMVLLDVRQPEEWDEVRIEGATLVPLGELLDELPKLSLPKDRQVICICRSGRRSGMAAEFLRSQGYPALNMEGGLRQWFIHQNTEGTLSVAEFKRVMEFLGPH